MFALLACGLLELGAVGHSKRAFAQAPSAFHFEAVGSLDDMRHLIEARFPAGSPRDAVRRAFVEQGGATLKRHPTQANVEKYIYDINLCSYYVWRWNISADFDADSHLLQAYVNGEPVFATGPQKKDIKDFKTGHHSIYKMTRLRPEASKGERQLAYILIDADSDLTTIDDQLAVGAGPTRADPAHMGALHAYGKVDPWRSIFDKDDAARIVAYSGDCKEADELYQRPSAGVH
jgi:hypothetical protein